MSIGDGISGLGATRHLWVRPVRKNIQLVLADWPHLTANTYQAHPWRGWMRWSVDFWGSGGRGDPGPLDALVEVRRFLMNRPGPPLIRHTILEHQLWTRWGGLSTWRPDDHSGRLRHLHVTYLK